MQKKLKQQDYLKWKQGYFAGNSSLRFGQAFLNHFFPTHACPELFYETDFDIAEDLIYEKYLDLENV